MYYEVRFDFSGLQPAALGALFPADHADGRVHARDLRKCLARLNSRYNIDLPAEIFGGERARVVMRDTPTGIAMQANGPAAVDLVRECVPAIHSALTREAQSMIPMLEASGEHGAALLPYARSFFVPSLVLGSPQPQSRWWRYALDAKGDTAAFLGAASAALSEVIVESLVRQWLWQMDDGDTLDPHGDLAGVSGWGGCLGQALADPHHLSEACQDLQSRLQLSVTGIGRVASIRWLNGTSRLVRLRDVEFEMHAALQGPWWIGRATIEGHGAVRDAIGDA